MTLMMTLLHFDYPGWLAGQGGMLSGTAVESFRDLQSCRGPLFHLDSALL